MGNANCGGVVFAVAVGLILAGAGAAYANSVADIIFVVDESGSMDTEHAWLKDLVDPLHTALADENIEGKYGLVGFGGSSGGSHYWGHKHLVGGADFGDPAAFKAAVDTLILTGGTEDGWDGIDTAMNDYAFDQGAAINVILVTDEDRDTVNGALTYAGVLASLTGEEALLNAVVNASFADGAGAAALGVDSEGNAYIADGSGGYTTSGGGIYTGSVWPNTKQQYIDMAWDTEAAAWDLNKLRAGGVTAQSFSAAFVDIKVEEIQQQIIPEPVTAAGLMLGVGCLVQYVCRRRSR